MLRKISVKETGAKGDGITDDTEAFRLALMQEGEVHLPDGMYVINGALPVSRLCRGISSDRQGGIILARHPEWGYDFARYFRSTVIVPTPTSYRLECAALKVAIKICVKAGHTPDWLHRWKVKTIALPEFYIKHLNIIGAMPAAHRGGGIGGIYYKSHDPYLQFTVYGNHFMTEEWRSKIEGKKDE